MQRTKLILGLLAVMMALVVVSAAPAMAHAHNGFNNFDGVNGFNSCGGFCNGGFENGGFFPSFTPFFGTGFFENEGPCDQLLLIQTSQTLCV